MFDALSRLFSAPSSSEAAPVDEKLAVAALLVHLASVDGVATKDEQDTIAETLGLHFGLGKSEVEKLVAEAMKKDKDAVDFYQFTSTLSRLEEDEKLSIIRLMWQVVYADDHNHELEDNMVWRVAELIGVSARQRTMLRAQIKKTR